MFNLILSNFLVSFLATAFVGICLLMILLILIQRPKGGGLAGAFGGAGGGSTAVFGAKTGDVLTIVTVSFFVIFILLAISLNYTTRWEVEESGTRTTSPAGNVEGIGDIDTDINAPVSPADTTTPPVSPADATTPPPVTVPAAGTTTPPTTTPTPAPAGDATKPATPPATQPAPAGDAK